MKLRRSAAALLLAAGASLVSRFWDDMDELARVTVLVIATGALLVLGWVIRSSAEPAVDRLAGVLWVGAVGTSAGLAAVIAVDVANADGRIPNLAAGLAAMAVAIPLYLLRRKALQHIALFLGATLAVPLGRGCVRERDQCGPAGQLSAPGACRAARPAVDRRCASDRRSKAGWSPNGRRRNRILTSPDRRSAICRFVR